MDCRQAPQCSVPARNGRAGPPSRCFPTPSPGPTTRLAVRGWPSARPICRTNSSSASASSRRTARDLEEATSTGDRRPNIDDVRRALRLGMGPCQGGFCTYRATGHPPWPRAARPLEGERRPPAPTSSRSGGRAVHPILYGDQLRQARLDDWLFQGPLDVEHLPRGGPPSGRMTGVVGGRAARGARRRPARSPSGRRCTWCRRGRAACASRPGRWTSWVRRWPGRRRRGARAGGEERRSTRTPASVACWTRPRLVPRGDRRPASRGRRSEPAAADRRRRPRPTALAPAAIAAGRLDGPAGSRWRGSARCATSSGRSWPTTCRAPAWAHGRGAAAHAVVLGHPGGRTRCPSTPARWTSPRAGRPGGELRPMISPARPCCRRRSWASPAGRGVGRPAGAPRRPGGGGADDPAVGPGMRLEGLLVAALGGRRELVLGRDAVGVEGARGRATAVLVHRAAGTRPVPADAVALATAGSRRAASTSLPRPPPRDRGGAPRGRPAGGRSGPSPRRSTRSR